MAGGKAPPPLAAASAEAERNAAEEKKKKKAKKKAPVLPPAPAGPGWARVRHTGEPPAPLSGHTATLMRGGEIFVPKIEKTTIVGLAKALGGPGTAIDEIGIRPGEKLHEALLTEHQQPATVELADRFVICPILDWWERAGVQRVYTDALGATAVAEGYTYTSKSAPAMAAGDVRALLERDRVQGNNALPAWDESTL